MAYTISHTQIGKFPYWYHLESCGDEQRAKRRANQYALDHGGYVCVKDASGKVIFGTDPVQLDIAITTGTNRDFSAETARRRGCCV